MAIAAGTEKSGKVVIRNVGLMLSGDIDRPILDADTVVIEDGLIAALGREQDCDTERAARVIDARGTALAPGLIDSHVHPVFGDWTPRQNQLGWIESCLHGGVTQGPAPFPSTRDGSRSPCRASPPLARAPADSR